MKLYDVYVVTFESDEEIQVELCGTAYSMLNWTKRFLEWAGHDFNAEYESEEAFLDEVDNWCSSGECKWYFSGAKGDVKIEVKLINY